MTGTTPRPWGITIENEGDEIDEYRRISSATNRHIAHVFAADDAELIVKAANAYNDVKQLVEALELCSGALSAINRDGVVSPSRTIAFTGDFAHFGRMTINQILDTAEAALARAKGGTAP